MFIWFHLVNSSFGEIFTPDWNIAIQDANQKAERMMLLMIKLIQD